MRKYIGRGEEKMKQVLIWTSVSVTIIMMILVGCSGSSRVNRGGEKGVASPDGVETVMLDVAGLT